MGVEKMKKVRPETNARKRKWWQRRKGMKQKEKDPNAKVDVDGRK